MNLPKQLFLIALLLALSTGQAAAAVSVYGQGTYTDQYLELKIFADITTTALLSYGIRITYDTSSFSSDINAISVVKNSSVWYFGRLSDPYPTPNAEPDISTPGAVVIVGGKCDIDTPAAGVMGSRVLLATITFTRLNSTLPAIGLYLGKGGNYANFVQTDGQVLDASLTSGSTAIGSVTLCPNCSGTAVVLENVVFPGGAECTCTATQSITTGSNVVIQDGAAVTFNAPLIRILPGLSVEDGATFRTNP